MLGYNFETLFKDLVASMLQFRCFALGGYNQVLCCDQTKLSGKTSNLNYNNVSKQHKTHRCHATPESVSKVWSAFYQSITLYLYPPSAKL